MSDKKIALLIDADVLVHKVSRAAEKCIRWDNGVWTWHAEESEADLILDSYLEKLKEKTNADIVVMCLSDTVNFRHSVFKEYKLGRDNPDSYAPMLKKYIREKFLKDFNAFMIAGLEADDVLGILMTYDKYLPDYTKVIATIDKDLDTIPGKHYNLNKELMYDVTDDYADYRFYYQTLMGDRVDGIPGCPGFGDKTSEKLLKSTEQSEWWNEIVKAYKKKGLDEEYALTMARLVRILRSSDWDRVNKKPME